MLKPKNNARLLTYLILGYVAFADALSLETSKWGPPCLVISEQQAANQQSASQTCATLHEGIARLTIFSWSFLTHDNVLAFGTLMIALFTLTLWRSTNKLWEAATKTAKAQSDDTRILQRAYVSVVPLGITPYNLRDFYGCHVGFHNSGNLPATHVRWFMRRKVSTDPERDFFPINKRRFEGDLIIAQRITAPKGAFGISKRFIERFNKGNNGRNRFVYVWGEVRYIDGFGRERWTRFCHRYNLAAFNPISGIYDNAARYHEHGNHTDED
jgi:hypothetical protein